VVYDIGTSVVLVAASLHDQLSPIDSVFSFSFSAATFVVVVSNTFFHTNIIHII
jgi:hypothetical protein